MFTQVNAPAPARKVVPEVSVFVWYPAIDKRGKTPTGEFVSAGWGIDYDAAVREIELHAATNEGGVMILAEIKIPADELEARGSTLTFDVCGTETVCVYRDRVILVRRRASEFGAHGVVRYKDARAAFIGFAEFAPATIEEAK